MTCLKKRRAVVCFEDSPGPRPHTDGYPFSRGIFSKDAVIESARRAESGRHDRTEEPGLKWHGTLLGTLRERHSERVSSACAITVLHMLQHRAWLCENEALLRLYEGAVETIGAYLSEC
jgi:hypothetical protein